MVVERKEDLIGFVVVLAKGEKDLFDLATVRIKLDDTRYFTFVKI